jgi:hypothetical protein
MSDDSEPAGDTDREMPDGPPTTGQRTVIPGLTEYWKDLAAEVAAVAAEYRDEGWEVLETHPGDVAPLPPGEHDRWGLDVVVPGDELASVQELIDDAPVDELDVFRTVQGEVVLLLIAAKATAAERAILVPVYYRESDAAPVRAAARERGIVHVHLRPLTQEPIVTFSHEQPELFFPD